MPETVTSAFGVAPASAAKTALITDFDALHTEIATAAAAGAFSNIVRDQLQSELVDLAERVAANMKDHV